MKKLLLLLVALFTIGDIALAADKFIVVIDPGHGGRDPGAVRGKIREKDINLDVALYLGKLIEDNHPDAKVIYTRKTDVAVDIYERPRIANRAKADLFISIHTNSTKAIKSTAYGAETYTLGLHRSNENLEAARRENAAVMYEDNYQEKYKKYNSNSPEFDIMIEFEASKHMTQSIELASYIQNAFKTEAKRVDNGVRQSGFWVLVDTAMPSVLIELGYISNPIEAKYMSSTIGKRGLANAIYSGFKKYKGIIDKRGASSEIVADVSAMSIVNEEVAEVSEQNKIVVSEQIDVKTESAEKVQASNVSTSGTTRYYKKPKQDPVVAKPQNETKKSEDTVVLPVQSQPVPKTIVKPATPAVSKSEPEVKTVEKQAKVESSIPADAVEYRVQFFISKTELSANSSQLKGVSPVDSYYDGGYYKYTYGSTTDKSEAHRLRRKISSKFPDAFVIEFKNGKRMK
ncbi:N-acetylmuramoyl-L-alanine amidase [Dysgonomonas sp. 216]|uniref:N-acetylmuramoyl-L-alanine amidase family protein n=1 Tax=Dysgonomonas sp. 216 TaxID=2302934 RepID=UPI0013CFAA50|nr:N-acetylmuramoyl-L-alanine amidase [Dysgonomonas sp. 216]NDW18032.1 N-acetylmuramoyl-L-alanine amidase [Dysgonomonas sp. 216]